METISMEEWLDLCVKYGCWTIAYYEVCDKTFQEVVEMVKQKNWG